MNMLTTNFSKSMICTITNKLVANPYNVVILLSSLRFDMIETIIDSNKIVLRGNLFSFFFTGVWVCHGYTMYSHIHIFKPSYTTQMLNSIQRITILLALKFEW